HWVRSALVCYQHAKINDIKRLARWIELGRDRSFEPSAVRLGSGRVEAAFVYCKRMNDAAVGLDSNNPKAHRVLNRTNNWSHVAKLRNERVSHMPERRI